MRMLKKVNQLVEEEPDALLLLEDHSIERTTDMEIFIHTKEGLIPDGPRGRIYWGECL